MAIQFRALEASEIEVRVAQCSEKGAGLLLYKTARTDYQLLDETVGAENWQCLYQEIKGNLFCGIEIYCEGRGWVTKSNCGTESNMEAQKGEASDALKRAGFAWGIGRELYTAPFIWVMASKLKQLKKNANGRWQCFDKFQVSKIKTVNGKIEDLEIKLADGGEKVFSLKQKTAAPKVKAQPTPKVSTNEAATLMAQFAELTGHGEKDVQEALNACKAISRPVGTVLADYLEEEKDIAANILRGWIEKTRHNASGTN